MYRLQLLILKSGRNECRGIQEDSLRTWLQQMNSCETRRGIHQNSATGGKDIDTIVVQFLNTTDFDGYERNVSDICDTRIVKILRNTNEYFHLSTTVSVRYTPNRSE